MKAIILLAAAGSVASTYISTNLQPLLSRGLYLSFPPEPSISVLTTRNFNPKTPSLRRRGLGSKLASCIGKLCGRPSVASDQSTRGPGFTHSSFHASSNHPAVQLVPIQHQDHTLQPSRPTLQRQATPHPGSPSGAVHDAPNRHLMGPSSLERISSQRDPPRRTGSSGEVPMPVAIGPHASPASWSWMRHMRGIAQPRQPTGSSTDSEFGENRSSE